MSKTYFVSFNTVGPANQYAGLSPTFTTFITEFGALLPSPSIAEVGSSTGMYVFRYTPSTTQAIVFEVDGGSVITAIADRYVDGTLDPIQAVDQTVGYPTDSYGTTVLPGTVFGYVQRTVQETESDAFFDKTTGVWTNYAKGTSTILYQKNLTNNPGSATKT